MNLNNMTVADLRKIAAELDIPGRSTMKKADLIAAIEFIQMKQVEMNETPASDPAFDHAAVVAKMRANVDAEEEAKAAARRARNRTNYAPAPAAVVNEVAILRDAPGRAIVTAAFDGRTVGGSIVRKGKRPVLVAGNITVTGNSFEKIAKLFALRLGFRADRIDVARGF